MKIGEWDNLGRARALLQRQLGDLGATEYAAHVAVNADNGRLRILVATDVGLLDYHYSPAGSDPEGAWILRGQLHRWASVHGLRLQTDAQLDDASGEASSVWRLVAEDPKIELGAATEDGGDRAVEALLGLARACVQHAG
ncbi:MAG: hypothetical protein ACRDGD_05905 [Candidatus Limnocylindria bacterium]